MSGKIAMKHGKKKRNKSLEDIHELETTEQTEAKTENEKQINTIALSVCLVLQKRGK